MNKDSLLKSIAETGYNVGFGAKKHFATLDIIQKVPGLIGFLGFFVGIFGLMIPVFSSKFSSATLITLSLAALYINPYAKDQESYDLAGKSLTKLLSELRDLYRFTQSADDIESGHAVLKDIETRFHEASISNQAFGSDLYAHYKFFGQMQHDWIDEQIKFTWKHKIPASVYFVILTAIFLVGIIFVAT